jgi:hypothetical protein
MKKKPSTAQRIYAMIDSGYNNKAIIAIIKCKPQAVYNARYHLNKGRGLGSIGPAAPLANLDVPPKRKYTRKVKAGTGIVDTRLMYNPAQNAYQFEPSSPMHITMAEPTLWERIKGWFRG